MPYLPSRLPAAQHLRPVRISNPPWIVDVFFRHQVLFPFHHPGFSRGGRERQLAGPDSSAAGAASGVAGKPSGTFHEKQYPSHKKHASAAAVFCRSSWLPGTGMKAPFLLALRASNRYHEWSEFPHLFFSWPSSVPPIYPTPATC